MSTQTFTFSIPFKTDYGNAGRCRNCDTNLTSGSPADQYQRLKIIQNTVRVYSSLYTMNKGSLSAYVRPTAATYNVNWSQMSDRPVPSIQRAVVPTGYNTSIINNRRHSVTGSRPGAQTPGGVGCDIKHNSYDRYLNRLKGKGPLRQQTVPPDFGAPLPFVPAYPVYGGKTMKTSIISGCNCSPGGDQSLLYKSNVGATIKESSFSLSVGEFVYALYPGGSTTCYYRAVILAIIGDVFTIQFDDGTQDTQTLAQLRIYYPCSPPPIEPSTIIRSVIDGDFVGQFENSFNVNCIYPNNAFTQELFA